MMGWCPIIVNFSRRHYVNLQKIYQAKAEADSNAVEQRVRGLLKKIGRDSASISKQNIKSFCRNARKLKVSAFPCINASLLIKEYHFMIEFGIKQASKHGFLKENGFYVRF